jgi:hypothetical protein
MSNEEKQQDDQMPVTPWNLAIYYRRLFPSHIYCKWLAYGERESRIHMQPQFQRQWNQGTCNNRISYSQSRVVESCKS